MSNDTRIAVDVAKAVFEIGVSDLPGHVVRRETRPEIRLQSARFTNGKGASNENRKER